MLSETKLERIKQEQEKYPHPRTGIIHALFVAQEEKNYIEKDDVEQMAETMDLDASEIWSVASFYTMINQEQVGEFKIQVCDNLPCLVEGAGEIVDHLESRLNVENGETTPDGLFTLQTVECLGSCGTGPLCQINDESYHENLSIEDVDDLLDELRERAETEDRETTNDN